MVKVNQPVMTGSNTLKLRENDRHRLGVLFQMTGLTKIRVLLGVRFTDAVHTIINNNRLHLLDLEVKKAWMVPRIEFPRLTRLAVSTDRPEMPPMALCPSLKTLRLPAFPYSIVTAQGRFNDFLTQLPVENITSFHMMGARYEDQEWDLDTLHAVVSRVASMRNLTHLQLTLSHKGILHFDHPINILFTSLHNLEHLVLHLLNRNDLAKTLKDGMLQKLMASNPNLRLLVLRRFKIGKRDREVLFNNRKIQHAEIIGSLRQKPIGFTREYMYNRHQF